MSGMTDQADTDDDGIGDLCDNCDLPNQAQVDTDGDGVGDNCEAGLDSDSDGISDILETSVFKTNPNAADTDGDGIPDRSELQSGSNPLNPLLAIPASAPLPKMLVLRLTLSTQASNQDGAHFEATTPFVGLFELITDPFGNTYYKLVHSWQREWSGQYAPQPHDPDNDPCICSYAPVESRAIDGWHGRSSNVDDTRIHFCLSTDQVSPDQNMTCVQNLPEPTCGCTNGCPANIIFDGASGLPGLNAAMDYHFNMQPCEEDVSLISVSTDRLKERGAFVVPQVCKSDPRCEQPGCIRYEYQYDAEVFPLVITHPYGDPVAGTGKAEFVFGNAYARDGTVSDHTGLKVSMSAAEPPAGSLKLEPDVVEDLNQWLDWRLEPNPEWTGANSTWQLADPTYVGQEVTIGALPADNDEFGPKTAVLLFDGEEIDRQSIELFFEKDGFDHPSSNSDPNWFYYWEQVAADTIAPGISLTFGGSTGSAFGETLAMSRWSYDTLALQDVVVIYNGAADQIVGCPSISQANLTGIDAFVAVAKHEATHADQVRRANLLLASRVFWWQHGWSWNVQTQSNHYSLGADGAPGLVSVDDDNDAVLLGQAGIDNYEYLPRFELGFGDDVPLDCTQSWPVPFARDWPDAWPLPCGVSSNCCGNYAIEHEAVQSEPLCDGELSGADWASPGKNHKSPNYSD